MRRDKFDITGFKLFVLFAVLLLPFLSLKLGAQPIMVNLGKQGLISETGKIEFTELNGKQLKEIGSIGFRFDDDSFIRAYSHTSSDFYVVLLLRTSSEGNLKLLGKSGYLIDSEGAQIPGHGIVGTAYSTVGSVAIALFPLVKKKDGALNERLARPVDFYGVHFDLAFEETSSIVINSAVLLLNAGRTVIGVGPGIPTETNPQGGSPLGWGELSWSRHQLRGITNAIRVAASKDHGVILRTDGTVRGFGTSLGGESDFFSSLKYVIDIAAGKDHILALRADGKLEAWGSNERGQSVIPISAPTNIVAIAAGDFNNYALLDDGTIYAWPMEVPKGEIEDAIELSAAGDYCVAVRGNGQVYAYGTGEHGQLNVPAEATNVVRIAAGATHVLALRADGAVVAWGDQTGGKCNVPENLTEVEMVAVGVNHSLALKRDGTIVAWGLNQKGQLDVPPGYKVSNIFGAPEGSIAITRQPVFIEQPLSIDLSAGDDHLFSAELLAGAERIQWFKDNQELVGQTNIALTLENVQAVDDGYYYLAASNNFGLITSDVARLSIQESIPRVVQEPMTLLPFQSGIELELSIDVRGSEPFRYSWSRNGLEISEATNKNLTLPTVSAEDSGLYTVLVENKVGSLSRGPYELTDPSRITVDVTLGENTLNLNWSFRTVRTMRFLQSQDLTTWSDVTPEVSIGPGYATVARNIGKAFFKVELE